jgi:hypothetical protein
MGWGPAFRRGNGWEAGAGAARSRAGTCGDSPQSRPFLGFLGSPHRANGTAPQVLPPNRRRIAAIGIAATIVSQMLSLIFPMLASSKST